MVSPRYPRSLALALLYHGQRGQSFPEQVEAAELWDVFETGAEGVEVRGAVEVPRDRPAPAPRGSIPSTSWEVV